MLRLRMNEFRALSEEIESSSCSVDGCLSQALKQEEEGNPWGRRILLVQALEYARDTQANACRVVEVLKQVLKDLERKGG